MELQERISGAYEEYKVYPSTLVLYYPFNSTADRKSKSYDMLPREALLDKEKGLARLQEYVAQKYKLVEGDILPAQSLSISAGGFKDILEKSKMTDTLDKYLGPAESGAEKLLKRKAAEAKIEGAQQGKVAKKDEGDIRIYFAPATPKKPPKIGTEPANAKAKKKK